MNRNKAEKTPICISIVSHGQGALVRDLLADLQRLQLTKNKGYEIIVTLNIPEPEDFLNPFLDMGLRVIRNQKPKGFGANHNAAFSESTGDYFVVMNPDVRVHALDFHKLISVFDDVRVAIVAPLVVSDNGIVEDSARRFPTLWRFAKRVLLRQRSADYNFGASSLAVDWVAGMFLMFRMDAFREIGGFDDRRFFMYLEDTDISYRLRKNGWEVVVNPSVQITHMAQRASRRHLKHLQWHIVSALRYLTGI